MSNLLNLNLENAIVTFIWKNLMDLCVTYYFVWSKSPPPFLPRSQSGDDSVGLLW